jgi:hypothetical protein
MSSHGVVCTTPSAGGCAYTHCYTVRATFIACIPGQQNMLAWLRHNPTHKYTPSAPAPQSDTMPSASGLLEGLTHTGAA